MIYSDNVRFSSFLLHNRDHRLSWNDWLLYPLSIARKKAMVRAAFGFFLKLAFKFAGSAQNIDLKSSAGRLELTVNCRAKEWLDFIHQLRVVSSSQNVAIAAISQSADMRKINERDPNPRHTYCVCEFGFWKVDNGYLLQDLHEILMKPRDDFQYCLLCGCQYESMEALLANCPGINEDDH
ncbi:G patch domain-containing protein 11 [Tanacetum coccineum]|uniref:G patch domain-containing protein 11 n=1 Tax=Tanacetum coccineum TaxID=301880 RepID=A0ABQ5ISB5_9ASTR